MFTVSARSIAEAPTRPDAFWGDPWEQSSATDPADLFLPGFRPAQDLDLPLDEPPYELEISPQVRRVGWPAAGPRRPGHRVPAPSSPWGAIRVFSSSVISGNLAAGITSAAISSFCMTRLLTAVARCHISPTGSDTKTAGVSATQKTNIPNGMRGSRVPGMASNRADMSGCKWFPFAGTLMVTEYLRGYLISIGTFISIRRAPCSAGGLV